MLSFPNPCFQCFQGYHKMSKHSRLIYWLLVQHYLSKVVIFLYRLELTDLDTTSSDSSFSNLYLFQFSNIFVNIELNLS